jgi:hypothetical protein
MNLVLDGSSLVDRGASTVVAANGLSTIVVAAILAAQCFDALFPYDRHHN